MIKNGQTTIRDIAIRLNISVSTVSRSLRNAPDVNPETLKAVHEMARTLRYEPNRIAQSLRSKKTFTIGVVVPEIAMHFFSSAISGIQEYAANQHYSTVICQSIESFVTEKSNIQMLISNRVDGLLISLSRETKTFEHIQQLIDRKIPVVLFDRVAFDVPVSKVMVDDHDGAFKATEYLRRTNCSRIAYLGGPAHLSINRERQRGYEDALKKSGAAVKEELIVHCENLDDPAHAIDYLLQQKPDAIFCMNDPLAIKAMVMLKAKKIKIPGEISIVGFTNEPVSQHIEPSLTTVSQRAYEMGKMAAHLFFEQINAGQSFSPITEVIPTELMIRNSTKPIGQ